MKNIRYFITIMTILLAFSVTAACEPVVRELPDTASPGEAITVRLTQEGFLVNLVEVTEVLPEGFEYMAGSFTGSHTPTYHANNNTLVMVLTGEDEITGTYTVIAGTFEQISAKFNGTYQGFIDFNPTDGSVTGDDTLTPVQPPDDESDNGDTPAPSPTPTQTATGVIETPAPVETATSVETPTADETPTVTETATETATETVTAPAAAKTPKQPKSGIPGFEGVFAIAGLMALVLIMRRGRNS